MYFIANMKKKFIEKEIKNWKGDKNDPTKILLIFYNKRMKKNNNKKTGTVGIVFTKVNKNQKKYIVH